MTVRRALLALLLAGCAAEAARAPSGRTYTEPIAIFVSPDSAARERVRRERGSDFEVIADDAMWYLSEAMTLLDSLGVGHESVDHQPLRFRVAGEEREYRWEEMEGSWFVVLYDGSSEPRATYPVDIRESIGLFERESK